jgi:DNA-binding transcriptional MerR regulator
VKIGKLALAAQTHVEPIRYYEREGLLPPAPRSEGNYRIFGFGHAERLASVRRCRPLVMAVDEIRVLLRLTDEPQLECDEVNAMLIEDMGRFATRSPSFCD